MKSFAVLLCLCLLTASALTTGGRERICKSSSKAKCIWINDHLSKSNGFPLHGNLYKNSMSDMYCYEGSFWTVTPNPVVRFWDYLNVVVTTSTPNRLHVVYGNSSKVVLSGSKLATNHNVSSSQPVLISPYEVQCVAIMLVKEEQQGVSYSLHAKYQLALYFPALFLFGSFLLFAAPNLSKNVPLLYGAGVVIGILGSALIVLYIMSRFLPGRSVLGVGFLAGGYTLVGGLFYWFMQHMTEYWTYALGYVVVAGFISFAVLYRWGGVSNPRTLDIVRWTLQLLGACLVYWATSTRATSILLVALVGLIYATPLRFNPLLFPFFFVVYILSCIWWLLNYLNPFKPGLPKWRYLTMEEYEEEGRAETERALEKLREDCIERRLDTSPLRNQHRFARFLSGEDHVTMDEQVSHDWTTMDDSELEEEDDGDEDGINISSSPHRMHVTHRR